MLDTLRHCLCDTDETLNHLVVKKITKLHEKLREIFPVKESYSDIYEELAEKLPIGMGTKDIERR